MNPRTLYLTFIFTNIIVISPVAFQLAVDSESLSNTFFLLPVFMISILLCVFGVMKDKVGHPLTRSKASTMSAISIAVLFEFITDDSDNAYLYIGDLVNSVFKNMQGNIHDVLTEPDLYQTALPTIMVMIFLFFVYQSLKGAVEMLK